jgi:hypothetical protein
MAWDYTEKGQNAIWESFHYFKGNSSNGKIEESINPGRRWKLGEVRFYTTSAFRSNEYLIINLSSIKGSSYGYSLLSYLVSGSTSYTFNAANNPIDFLSDDQVIIKLTSASAVHIMGIEVVGWAVVGDR